MDLILLGHGSGGRLMHDLISEYLAPTFGIEKTDDSAVLSVPSAKLAFTTDSYVVEPIFFPGGDIGALAINGTVNDLAMVGAEPLYITVGFIMEEGFPIADLKKVLSSMRSAANEAGVRVVAGDTKVVQRGKADKIFINTSGIGIIRDHIEVSGSGARVGDRIILSGPIGNHGISVIAEREGLVFSPPVLSDTRPLNRLSMEMLAAGEVHAMRDPTRGGLATTLKEIALSSSIEVVIYEDEIPIEPAVKGACDMLGFDPLYVANEGVLVAFVSEHSAEAVLRAMRQNPYGKGARIIGEAVSGRAGSVLLRTAIGGTRVIDMLRGEQLPRIC